MNHLKARAIVASEYPERRHHFAGVVEDELGGVVVGEAESAVRALDLARTLRPDLMMVDDGLPYVVGVDGVRLSRIGGLDAALSVVQDLPSARVLLVSSDGVGLSQVNGWEGRMELSLYERTNPDGSQIEQLVTFTALRERPVPTTLRHKVMTVSEKGMIVGGLSMVAGVSLMFTILLAGSGIVMFAVGAAVSLLSLCASVVAANWPTRGRSGVVNAKTEGER